MGDFYQSVPYNNNINQVMQVANGNLDRNAWDSIGRGRMRDRLLAQLSTYGQDDEDGGTDQPGAGPDEGAATGGTVQTDAAGNPINGGGNAADAIAQSGKKADAIRKLITTYNPNLKDHVKALSTDQLEGVLQGYAVNSAMQERQQKIRMMAAQLQDFQAQAAQRNQGAADDQSLGEALKNYANADASDPEGDEPTQQDRMLSALKTPGLAGRSVPKLIEALSKYGEVSGDGAPVVTAGPFKGTAIVGSKSGRGGVHVVTDPSQSGEDLTPGSYEDPTTGQRFAFRGKQFLPAGVNPEKAQPVLTPQHDPETGDLIGWSQTDMRGHATFTPVKNGGLKQATDQDGQALAGFYMDPSGKLHDTRSALQKTMGTGAPAAPAKAGGVAQPKSKADLAALPAGALYVNPADGKTYRKK